MGILIWIYRILTLALLFIFAANAVNRFVALSFAGEVGLCLFIAANVLLFLVVLGTWVKIRMASPIVWSATIFWCLLFIWWAWIERQSSPFILHELHTFDPEEARLEINHFRLQAVLGFSILLIWFAIFPLLQRYSISCKQKELAALR